MRLGIGLVVLFAVGTTTVSAQRIAGPGPESARILARSELPARRDGLAIVPATHWRRGAVIGGLIGAVAWVAFVATLEPADPGQPSNLSAAILGAPVFFLVAALPGALIGGLFPKQE